MNLEYYIIIQRNIIDTDILNTYMLLKHIIKPCIVHSSVLSVAFTDQLLNIGETFHSKTKVALHVVI